MYGPGSKQYGTIRRLSPRRTASVPVHNTCIELGNAVTIRHGQQQRSSNPPETSILLSPGPLALFPFSLPHPPGERTPSSSFSPPSPPHFRFFSFPPLLFFPPANSWRDLRLVYRLRSVDLGFRVDPIFCPLHQFSSRAVSVSFVLRRRPVSSTLVISTSNSPSSTPIRRYRLRSVTSTVDFPCIELLPVRRVREREIPAKEGFFGSTTRPFIPPTLRCT